jgi:hypothetical protein
VPDFLLRGIDNALAERIKTVARERNWAINDVLLHLIRQALGEGEQPSQSPPESRDIAHLGGTWAPDESAAFRAALEAFENLPEGVTPTFPPGRR